MSSEFTWKCNNTNIMVQTIGGYSSSLNEKIETPNKTLANITWDLLLK